MSDYRPRRETDAGFYDTNTEGEDVTLTEFLLARITEDEEAARAASVGPWRAETYGNGFAPLVIGGDMAVAETFDKPHLSDARHIARHYPARVLAECEAKRRIVAQWRADAYMGEDGGVLGGQGPETHHETLQLLSLPYADHPDYRQEWKP